MFVEQINGGLIFANDKATKEGSPDYTGAINVEGKQMSIALWVKEFKNGEGFAVKLSESREEAPSGGGGSSRPAPQRSSERLTPRAKPQRR